MNELRLKQLIKEISSIATPGWTHHYDDFIPGQSPVYYSGTYFNEAEIESALTAFLTGKWLVSGEHVHKFQIEFAKKFGVKYAHMVNSGSSANLILITALKKIYGWKDGDEIIVSPVGFPTTISPIMQNNLKPIFVDIEMATLNFDVNLIEGKITDKTKAIFVSPVLGNPPDMDFLRELSQKYNIMLIGDNCDSLGTQWNRNHLTDYYVAWTTSFYPAHHITTGEGGMICSNDKEFIDTCRSLSWWGRDCYCVGAANLLPCGTCQKRFDNWLPLYDGPVDHKYVFTNVGYNLKPLDLQGAIGREQLKKFDEIHIKRRQSYVSISQYIDSYIYGAYNVHQYENAEPSWFGVPIICSTRDIKEKLQQHFESHKIQTRNYFAGNILLHPAYSHLDNYINYPNANKALSHVFFLGCPPHYAQNPAILTYIEKVCQLWNQ